MLINNSIDVNKFHGNYFSPSNEEFAIKEAIFDTTKAVTVSNNSGYYALKDVGDEQSYLTAQDDIFIPEIQLKNLGDPLFCTDYNITYPYIAGGMANGIASTEMVEAMGMNGMLGFFGAAGLPLPAIESAIDKLENSSIKFPFGLNLIHNPHEPGDEAAVVDLYLRRKIRIVEAAAFLDLTLPVVTYRVNGIHRDADGLIVTPNKIIAKVSRIEVASKFFSPPPEKILNELLAQGKITSEQAELAGQIPMAQDITAEADSGGHTDNRSPVTLIPTMIALRDQMQQKYKYDKNLRVGAAGGICTPSSVAAMFAMGAAYIVTGTINQACIESGTSDEVRKMLAGTKQADITMAPAADMFEMGVKVQVLKKGTLFAMRAAKLYDLYRANDGLDSISTKDREILEKQFFRSSLGEVWKETASYFLKRDSKQVERAENDPKHKMALVFRCYLGQSSHWANSGIPDRKIDYQIWCGPAMGAFNEWVKGSFLEAAQNRKVVTVGLNLLYGGAVCTRLNLLRFQGLSLPPELTKIVPVKLEKIRR